MVAIDQSEFVSRTTASETQGSLRPRVLIADDREIFLDHVTSLLKQDFDLVGAVNNGRALVCEAQRLRPDLIILDVSMPVLNGIDAAREIHAAFPDMKLLFFTVHTDPDVIRACFAEGGLGYVAKSRLVTDLMPAINEILSGTPSFLRLWPSEEHPSVFIRLPPL